MMISNQTTLVSKRIVMERRAKVLLTILVLGYLCMWTPYAMISIYTAFIDVSGVRPAFSVIPSLLTKLSMFWTSFFLIISNKNVRSEMRRTFLLRNSNNSRF